MQSPGTGLLLWSAHKCVEGGRKTNRKQVVMQEALLCRALCSGEHFRQAKPAKHYQWESFFDGSKNALATQPSSSPFTSSPRSPTYHVVHQFFSTWIGRMTSDEYIRRGSNLALPHQHPHPHPPLKLSTAQSTTLRAHLSTPLHLQFSTTTTLSTTLPPQPWSVETNLYYSF